MKIYELSIVIPCYNEEKNIKSTLNKILKYCKKNVIHYEIIVINDGSTDDTINIVNKFPTVITINFAFNHGKGAAVNAGFNYSKYGLVLFTDADLSTPIKEIEKLFPYLGPYDIIFGSRNINGSKREINQPFYRVLVGRAFPFFVNYIMKWKYKDTQCGFKLFNKKMTQEVFDEQTINGYAFDVELLYIAKKKNIKCKEVGVVWKNSPDSKVNIFRDGIKMFFEVLKIEQRHR